MAKGDVQVSLLVDKAKKQEEMWELDKDRWEKPRSGVVVMVSQIKIEEKKALYYLPFYNLGGLV